MPRRVLNQRNFEHFEEVIKGIKGKKLSYLEGVQYLSSKGVTISREQLRRILLNWDERRKALEEERKVSLERKENRLKQRIDKKKRILQVVENPDKVTTKGNVIENSSSGYEARNIDALQGKVIFRPNDGPQTDFLSSGEKDVLYGGAAGGGKSYAMLADPLRYAHNKNHRGLLLRRTLGELTELLDKSRELYSQAFPGAKFREQEKVWTFPSGAKIHFSYLDKDADVYRYQGLSFSWIGFDELTHMPTEFPWQYLGSRLRTTDPSIETYMRASTNPGGVGGAWVKKRYVEPVPPNTSFIGSDGLTRKFIPAKLADNPYLHENGEYERMLNSLDEVSRRRLLSGDWNINEGAAFPEFSREIHTIDPFDIPTSWFRFKGADYGYTSPSAALWLAVDPEDGTIIVYKELYEKGLTGEMLGERCVQMEASEITDVPGVLDTAAWNRTGYTGPTIGQILNGHPYNLKFRPADKNRVGGKVQIHERLKLKNGKPGLLIFNTCKNLISELESIPLSKSNSEDVDTSVSDHAYDALRYALMSRPVTTTRDQLNRFRREVEWRPVDPYFGY